MSQLSVSSIAEKYGGWILMSVFGWMALTTYQTSLAVVEIKASLLAATDDRYRAGDAARDQNTTNARMNALAERVSNLEQYHRSEPGK